MDTPEGIARRAWRRTAIIAIAGAVVGAGATLLTSGGSSPRETLWSVIGFGVALGGLSGTFSMLFTTFGLGQLARTPVEGLSFADRRSIGRSVRSGRALPEGRTDLQRPAVEHARVVSASLPMLLGQFLLLYAGIGGPQLAQLGADDHPFVPISAVIAIVLLVTAVVMTPIYIVQTRNARRFVGSSPSASEANAPLPAPTATED